MKNWILCSCLFFPVAVYAAEGDTPQQAIQEPTLHDHYVSLKNMQERLAGRSPEEQAKLQPQIQRAQRKACERLQKDHQDRISRESYRRQGGDEFLVFSLELEQWCATAR
jgi:Skp family chaperone for outer membrane proteins